MSCQGFVKFLRIFGTNNAKNTKYIDTKLIPWIFSFMFYQNHENHKIWYQEILYLEGLEEKKCQKKNQ